MIVAAPRTCYYNVPLIRCACINGIRGFSFHGCYSAQDLVLGGVLTPKLTGDESVLNSLSNGKYEVYNITITGIGVAYGILEDIHVGVGEIQTIICYNSVNSNRAFVRISNSGIWVPWKEL